MPSDDPNCSRPCAPKPKKVCSGPCRKKPPIGEMSAGAALLGLALRAGCPPDLGGGGAVQPLYGVPGDDDDSAQVDDDDATDDDDADQPLYGVGIDDDDAGDDDDSAGDDTPDEPG